MSELRDPGHPGPDRPGAGGGRPLARLFAIQLLAVLGITVVLTAAFALLKGDDDTTTTALDPPASTASAAPSATPAQSSPPATTAPPATSPPATVPPTTTAPPATTAAPSTAAPSTSAPAADLPEVVVFNQSAPDGTGEAAAQLLREKGWTIFKVDDFRGNVSTTTVYYPSGLEKQARRAARALPGDVRTREKFSNLSDTRLTLILTDDYGS
jgi:LytR cell envelope-related transcriptional attenuator